MKAMGKPVENLTFPEAAGLCAATLSQ